MHVQRVTTQTGTAMKAASADVSCLSLLPPSSSALLGSTGVVGVRDEWCDGRYDGSLDGALDGAYNSNE
jgi:hypothetical protein